MDYKCFARIYSTATHQSERKWIDRRTTYNPATSTFMTPPLMGGIQQPRVRLQVQEVRLSLACLLEGRMGGMENVKSVQRS
jgi:hypothetical protein